MARVLIIAIATLLGVASVWFIVPAPVTKVAGAPTSLPTFSDGTVKPRLSGSPMTAEKRRLRAEDLIGQKFKYISKDEVFSAGWFTDKGVPTIERAMDECAILADDDLFLRHILASADSSVTDTEDLDAMEHLKAMRPTFKQLRNCINAKIAYNGLFES